MQCEQQMKLHIDQLQEKFRGKEKREEELCQASDKLLAEVDMLRNNLYELQIKKDI